MTETSAPQIVPTPAVQQYAETCLQGTQEARENLRFELDVAFGTHERQKLDIYMPSEDPGVPMPILIFLHGGGWRQGVKDWMGFMAPSVVCLPAIFVSVGYRLAPETKYPGAEDDSRAGLAWVYNNISRYGGDPERIFVGGHSAGGHLAAMLALCPDRLEKHGLPPNAVKGCFAMAGVFDLATSRPDYVENFLPVVDQETLDKASPLRQVAGNKVPFHISIGEYDNPHLIPHASQLADALRKEGSPVEFLRFDGCDHLAMNLKAGEVDGIWAKTVRQWMQSPPA
jgi:acetyl esterase/lipase